MLGVVIGNYQLVRKLGEGGMGAVYLGQHMLLGRRAAIKVLLPQLSARPDIVSRFFNEARAVTSISDPGIVQVFDFGYHTDGSAFIVMEYLEGEPLDQRLAKRRRLPVVDALRLVRQLSTSLAAAHAQHIIHRDLKPENIFLVRDAEVATGERSKILDFGIAKLSDEDPGKMKTHVGALMGTPVYMSPEQCRGLPDIDHRADIYSLVCVLFHLITGRPPFEGVGMGDLISAHIREPAPAPSSLVAGVPASVDALVLRCLAKAPAERCQSMIELGAAIGHVLSQLPAEAVPGYAHGFDSAPVGQAPYAPSPRTPAPPGPPGTRPSTQPPGMHPTPAPSGMHASMTPSGMHASMTPSGMHASMTPSGMHASMTPAGMHASTQPPGMHAPTQPPGMHAPTQPPGMHAPTQPPGMHGSTQPPPYMSNAPTTLGASNGQLAPSWPPAKPPAHAAGPGRWIGVVAVLAIVGVGIGVAGSRGHGGSTVASGDEGGGRHVSMPLPATAPVPPATPGTPGTPSAPAMSGTPGTPAAPAAPGTSGTPSAPAAPATPGTPSAPGTSGTPSAPAAPGTPGTPSAPASPGTPGTPSAPATPGTPAMPAAPPAGPATTPPNLMPSAPEPAPKPPKPAPDKAAAPVARPTPGKPVAPALAAKPGPHKCNRAEITAVNEAAAPSSAAVHAALRGLKQCHDAGAISDADFDRYQTALVAKL